MAVGDSALLAALSYLGVGRETAYGTYTTAPSGLEFLSANLKTLKQGKIVEAIESSRTYANRFQVGKVVEGELEFYFSPQQNACNYILHGGFGADTITSATATGETIGGGAITHTINVGNFSNSYTSLCFNLRKGDSTSGKVFEYSGARVNDLTFSAEIDEALKCSAAVVCKDSTLTTNNIGAGLSIAAFEPLVFTNGRISVETSFASLTSTSFWHVQSAEFGIANNLKTDSGARRIGSDTLSILPPGIANFTLNMTLRFNTTTAYDAMLAATQFACELEFLGNTISGSAVRSGLKFQMPRIYVDEAGDPEIGGPDEILTSQVSFHVLRDESSAGGYALRALVTNTKANYL